VRKALFLRSKNAPKIKKVPLKLYQIHDSPEIGIAAYCLPPLAGGGAEFGSIAAFSVYGVLLELNALAR
jgi:hypothetical protein